MRVKRIRRTVLQVMKKILLNINGIGVSCMKMSLLYLANRSISTTFKITLLAFLGFASTLSTAVVFPNIGAFVRDRFVLSDTEASLFAVSYLISHVIFAFVWGAVADRTGRKRFLHDDA